MSNKKISFVILTWNRAKMLKICLDELVCSISDKNSAEIIILDNYSSDNTREVITEFSQANEKYIDITTIFSQENKRLNAYKELFFKAKGNIVVEVDDDVLSYPKNIDLIFQEYFNKFPDFGFLCLDVIQNEFTNGAKPPVEAYLEIERENLIIQQGPTGGWCAGFRRRDFKKIAFLFRIIPLSMKHGEDGMLVRLFKLIFKKSGVIKDKKCFHACGSYYSKQFDLLERDIEKYKVSGLHDFVEKYSNIKE